MQKNVRVREATINDAYIISELVIQNAKATLFNHYSPEQFEVFIQYYAPGMVQEKIANHKFFCAEWNNEIVGLVGLDRNWVVGFYTKVSLLNKGIGTILMNFLEAYALKNDIHLLKLASSPVGVAYYYKKGWKKIKEAKLKYLGVEFDETIMEKTISRE